MKGETLGSKIAALRKQKGMTQQELAEPLGVTDKAVSKWERDLSCPDVGTLPKLAQLLDVTVDELMREGNTGNPVQTRQWEQILDLILKAVPLAMGIALTVVSVLKKDLELPTVAGLAGIGLFGISLYHIRKE